MKGQSVRLHSVFPEAVFDVACFKQHVGRAGHPWSDAAEEGDTSVACTHIGLEAPVWCGVYKPAAMLGHAYTALCRILSVQTQAVC